MLNKLASIFCLWSIVAFIVAGIYLAPAHSLTHRGAVFVGPPPAGPLVANNCATPDMTMNTADAGQAISDCHISSGPNGSIFVLASGEITCQSPSDIMTYLVAGNDAFPDPPTGASFTGSVASGVLTVTSMITPYPEYTITSGLTLFDGGNGAAGTIPVAARGNVMQVTSQIDGPTGGTGHYNVNDLTASVSSETIWAAPIVGSPQSAPLHGSTISRDPMEQLACQAGQTLIATMSGALSGVLANRTFWVKVMMTAEKLGGLATMANTWRNGQISMVSLR